MNDDPKDDDGRVIPGLAKLFGERSVFSQDPVVFDMGVKRSEPLDSFLISPDGGVLKDCTVEIVLNHFWAETHEELDVEKTERLRQFVRDHIAGLKAENAELKERQTVLVEAVQVKQGLFEQVADSKIQLLKRVARLEAENAELKSRTAKDLLDRMTADQRTEVFSNYCSSCGRGDPDCQCWNDE